MLTDEIAQLMADNKTHRPSNKCSALHAIDQFEGDDREAIVKLLDSEVLSARVSQYLATKGIQITPQKVQNHRRRFRGTGCSCSVTL
jgi:hypothetical protein